MTEKRSISINLNEPVRVKLTDAGHAWMVARWTDPVGDVIETELWDLMRLFGERMQMGRDAMFVENEIEVIR